MILNDFGSSTILEIQIQVLITEFENHKNPGIQPSYLFDKENSLYCLIMTESIFNSYKLYDIIF